MNITFCCTNLDLYSLKDFYELERQGLSPHTVHCLGLCHFCAQGKLALVDGDLIVGDSVEDLRLALQAMHKSILDQGF